MKFTKYDCKCGEYCNARLMHICDDLLTVINEVEHHFNEKIIVIDAIRCRLYNHQLGGREESYHLYAMAVDFKINRFNVFDIYDFLIKRYPHTLGIIVHTTANFIHVDVRKIKERGIKL